MSSSLSQVPSLFPVCASYQIIVVTAAVPGAHLPRSATCLAEDVSNMESGVPGVVARGLWHHR